jgi:hypothetical protein
MDLRGIGLEGGWIGFDGLRTGTGGGLLWVRWWTFGFLHHGVKLISSVRLTRTLQGLYRQWLLLFLLLLFWKNWKKTWSAMLHQIV